MIENSHDFSHWIGVGPDLQTIAAMQERSYDLTTHTSKGPDAFNGQKVEVAIMMGCVAMNVRWSSPSSEWTAKSPIPEI